MNPTASTSSEGNGPQLLKRCSEFMAFHRTVENAQQSFPAVSQTFPLHSIALKKGSKKNVMPVFVDYSISWKSTPWESINLVFLSLLLLHAKS